MLGFPASLSDVRRWRFPPRSMHRIPPPSPLSRSFTQVMAMGSRGDDRSGKRRYDELIPKRTGPGRTSCMINCSATPRGGVRAHRCPGGWAERLGTTDLVLISGEQTRSSKGATRSSKGATRSSKGVVVMATPTPVVAILTKRSSSATTVARTTAGALTLGEKSSLPGRGPRVWARRRRCRVRRRTA